MPPKFAVSCGSFDTVMISGKSSIPFTNGYSTGSPMRRANARNASSETSWSRKNTTRWSSQARRISATVSSGRLVDRSTPPISAPSAPAIGATVIVRYATAVTENHTSAK